MNTSEGIEARYAVNGMSVSHMNSEQRQLNFLLTNDYQSWMGMALNRLSNSFDNNEGACLRNAVDKMHSLISSRGIPVNSDNLVDLIETSNITLAESPMSRGAWAALNWLERLVVDGDSRVRTNFLPYHCSTGRTGLLGATPINGYKKFKADLIQAPTGSVVICVDYVACEIGILAAKSNDKTLIGHYENSHDIYETSASELEVLTKIKLDRGQVKFLFVLAIYDASSETIAAKLHIIDHDAYKLQKALKSLYPNAFSWLDQQTYAAYREGLIKSMDWQMYVHGGSKRTSVRNWPIQAAGVDVINRACLLTEKQGVKVIGVVHDCIYFECKRVLAHEHYNKVVAAMTQASSMVLNGFKLKVSIDFIAGDQSPMKNI